MILSLASYSSSIPTFSALNSNSCLSKAPIRSGAMGPGEMGDSMVSGDMEREDWGEIRYGVVAPLIGNGVDAPALESCLKTKVKVFSLSAR